MADNISTPPLYRELYRPQVHFSPPAHWMNDPNGMFYLEGTYHLFYQYYPDSTVWGPMHWGHATSTDLVHWENKPTALYPDELGYIFSGSAVVDENNTSGLGTAENPPVIAIFTHHDPAGEKAQTNDFQYQSIAYSLDKGETWTKYEGNPVLPSPGIKDFRDPKVFWHEETEAWVMILAVKDRVHLYRSPNLIDWTLASEFGADQGSHGGVWECPDLFELPVGASGQSKWVMLVSLGSGGPNGGSATQYFTGEFDGYNFTNDNSADTILWLDYGTDNYAGVTWSGIPDEDGRRIFIGWMSNWGYATKVPTETWRSAMTLPRTLNLIPTEAGPRIKTDWVEEVQSLAIRTYNSKPRTVNPTHNISDMRFNASSYMVEASFSWSEDVKEVGIEFSNEGGKNMLVGYSPKTQRLFVDRRFTGDSEFNERFAARHTAPLTVEGALNVRIIVDVSSVEVIAQDGTVVMTELFFPEPNLTRVQAYSLGGASKLEAASLTTLGSIWHPGPKTDTN